MMEFEDWFLYFDTIFAKKKPNINNSFLSMICQTKQTWPINSALPALCKCFEELQNFIISQNNWSESICTIGELNKIEADVSHVLLLLQIQKLYIIKFWNKKRRVEASITHFYALLQLFVGSIIPYDNMTLFECKAANKLCVRIMNLQDLFKQFMKKINTICNYFMDIFFLQENIIIKNFFQNFVAFMQLIPKIKKIKMFHISQLLRYLMIINPIQISINLNNQDDRLKIIRKLLKKQQQKKRIKQQIKRIKSLQKIRKQSDNIFRKKNKNKLKFHHSCPFILKIQIKKIKQFPKKLEQLKFNFPVWIRRHSIKNKKQSRPKIYIQPLIQVGKGKTSSEIYKSFSPRQSSQRKIILRNKSATKSSRFLFKSQSLTQKRGSPTKTAMLMKHQSILQKNSLAQSPFNQQDQINPNQVENINHIINEMKKKQQIQKVLLQKKKLFSLKHMCFIKQDEKQGIIPQLQDYSSVLKEIQKIILK